LKQSGPDRKTGKFALFSRLMAKEFLALGVSCPLDQDVLPLDLAGGSAPDPSHKLQLRARYDCVLLNFSLATPVMTVWWYEINVR